MNKLETLIKISESLRDSRNQDFWIQEKTEEATKSQIILNKLQGGKEHPYTQEEIVKAFIWWKGFADKQCKHLWAMMGDKMDLVDTMIRQELDALQIEKERDERISNRILLGWGALMILALILLIVFL